VNSWRPVAGRVIIVAALLGVTANAQPGTSFRAETRLVLLHVTVIDAHGGIVSNLEHGAFRVYEDGRPQRIALFGPDDLPISLGLVLDNSGSMRSLRATMQAAALAVARTSNPLDEIFVLNFADKPRIDVPFTEDEHAVEAGIARADSIGATAMRDAISNAASYLVEKASRDRRVLVVIGDGNDNASRMSSGELRRAVQRTGIVVSA
jgi:Ca-activated chloride channel homolog